ncbi:MAG: hypothetical protein V3S01_01875 [Dehalococcoidia bacterium]
MVAAQRAAELDQIDVFATLPDAVASFAGASGEGLPTDEAIAALKEAVGPGPLAGLVEKLG